MRPARKVLREGVLPWVLMLALTGMVAEPPPGMGYQLLNQLQANGLCAVRPSAAGAPYYAAMGRPSAPPLRDVEVMSHVATRLGYGISPFGPLVPALANDCTTVFFADETARQVALIGSNLDSPLLTAVRRGVLPLSRFPRADINAAVVRLINDPADNGAYSTLWYAARNDAANLMTLRDLVGSQTVVPGLDVVDQQMNLEAKLDDFWFNHFNVSVSKGNQYFYGSDSYPETIADNAGGTFYSLLEAVLHHPAMIVYLDNQANVYDSSTDTGGNQNLARELLELHTFGAGPTAGIYGQADVVQLAKILAGWSALFYRDPLAPGATGFVFNTALADPKAIPFLGVTYRGAGETRVESVLRFLANHPQTKKNICTELAGFLYAAPLVPAARDACVAAWGTDGQLKAIYAALLSRPAFWSRANYRTLYRTPVELVMATSRQLGANVVDWQAQLVQEGRTEAPFTPAGLTTSSFNAAYASFQHSGAHSYMWANGYRLQMLTGSLRADVAPPTGYSQDGSRYLSTGYLDTVSRVPLELAGALDYLTVPSRRDRASAAAFRAPLEASLGSLGASAAFDDYLTHALAVGSVLQASGSQPGQSPFTLSPLPKATAIRVAGTLVDWAFWETSPSTRAPEKTWPALALGNAQQLLK